MTPQLMACAFIGLYLVLTLASPYLLASGRLLIRHPRLLVWLWLSSLTVASVSLLIGLGIFIAGALRHHITHVSGHDVLGPLIDSLLGWMSIATLGIITFRLGVAVQDARSARRETYASLLPWLTGAGAQVIAGQQVWVLPSDEIFVAAVPRASRIVLTTGLCERLKPAELRAVIEHENSHLNRHHERLLVLGGLMEAVAPGLLAGSRLAQSMRIATELIADDDAAQMCGECATADALRRSYPNDTTVSDRARRLEGRLR